VAKSVIFTVGVDLPGPDFEYVPFDSNRTFLDTDVCIFQPTLGDVHYHYEGFQGHSLIDQSSSVDFKKNVEHWKNEIVTAASSGKLVVVFMAAPIELYYYTGRQEVSGTGRSQRRTNIVNPCSSYDSVPNVGRVTAKTGTTVKFTAEANFLKPYWDEFSKYSAYQTEFEPRNSTPILTAGSSDRTVGAIIRTAKGGAVLFLPPLDLKQFVTQKDDDEYWAPDGVKLGHRLAASLKSLNQALAQKSKLSPPPSWSLSPDYRLTSESLLLKKIEGVEKEIQELSKRKLDCERALLEAGMFRHLLYEQGAPLETAVLAAMKVFGFAAENFSKGGSEFDVVFVSVEGRCLGEVEGKENKAVNIEKFSQLERNIQEDFARDEVSDYAKAVLFGNAFRLKPLSERENYFTEKCISAARRVGAALVRTPDLFEPIKYLQENSDAAYAAACRRAIIETEGDVVTFPAVPNQNE